MALQQGTITITGNLGSDPVLLGTKEGSRNVCTFRLGCTRRYLDKQGEWKQLPTTWITVKAYRNLALNVFHSLHRGDAVIVSGVLSTEQWQVNDELRSKTLIEASTIGHDLNYVVTTVHKWEKSKNTTENQSEEEPVAEPVAIGEQESVENCNERDEEFDKGQDM